MKYLSVATLSLLLSLPALAEVTTTNAYVRAVPPGQSNSAAFMQLNNLADKGVSLVSATSNAAQTVELHTHIHDQGVMRMRQVDKIDIAAHATTSLQPGGFHVMLIGLNQDLMVGDEVSMGLTFSDGQTLELNLPVKAVESMMHSKMKH